MKNYVYIIYFSIIILMHLLILLLVLHWRKKNYHKFIHKTNRGIFLFIISFAMTIVVTLIGICIYSELDVAIRCVISYSLLTVAYFIVILYFMTFCIYIDGNYVVERYLFHKTKICLKEKNCSIKFYGSYAKINSKKSGKSISLRKKRIEGDLDSFIIKCRQIAYTDYDNKDYN